MSIRAALVVGAIGLASALSCSQTAPAWRTLFDGKSLDAFRGYKTATVPDGWRIADGASGMTFSSEQSSTPYIE